MAERTKKAGRLKKEDWQKIHEFAQLTTEYTGRDKMAFISKGLGWSPATISRVLNTASWEDYKGLIAHVGESIKHAKAEKTKSDEQKSPETKSRTEEVLSGILKALFAIKDELRKNNEISQELLVVQSKAMKELYLTKGDFEIKVAPESK